MAPMVISRLVMGLLLPVGITLWGLAQLKKSASSFILAPFYAVVFLVLWGETSALKLGF